MFRFMMNGFYEPEKNQKKARDFDTRFREHDQSVKMNAQGPFSFAEVQKVKNKLPHRKYYSFLFLQNF